MKQREVLLDQPQPDELDTHRQLLNWAAWCRMRGGRPGRCFSVEGRFIPPAQKVHNPPAPREEVDMLAAERVNSALLEVPAEHRRALVERYFYRCPDRVLARRLAIRPDSYQRFLRDARLMLRNRLRAGAAGPTLATHNSTPPSTDEREAQRRGLPFPAAA